MFGTTDTNIHTAGSANGAHTPKNQISAYTRVGFDTKELDRKGSASDLCRMH